MIKSLHTAATGMQAQQTNMDTIANNIANTSTTGFKKTRAEFEDLLYQNIKEPGSASGLNAVTPTGVQVGLGVKTAATQKDFSLGSLKSTERELDIAINGKGFLQFSRADGTTAYGRNGELHRSADGRIVDFNGNVLQPEITIPADAASLVINPQGEVSILSSDPEERMMHGPTWVRSAFRHPWPASYSSYTVGFRIARDLP